CFWFRSPVFSTRTFVLTPFIKQYQVPTTSIRFRLFQPAATHALRSRTGQTLAHAHPSFQKSCATPRYFQHIRKLRCSLKQRSPLQLGPRSMVTDSDIASYRRASRLPDVTNMRTTEAHRKGHCDLGVRNPCGVRKLVSGGETLTNQVIPSAGGSGDCVYKSRNTVIPPTAEATQNREERGIPGCLEHRPGCHGHAAAHNSSRDHG
ncbi:hypothetical protein EDB84DRAFT_1534924, partial [Lactarius hengduanensis]